MDESVQDVVTWLEGYPAMWLLIWETREQMRRGDWIQEWDWGLEWMGEIFEAFREKPWYVHDPVELQRICEAAADVLEQRGKAK